MITLFDSKNLFYKKPFGSVEVGTTVIFHFLSPKAYIPKKAILIIDNDSKDEISITGRWVSSKRDYDVYQVSWTPAVQGLYFYRFCVITYTDEWLFLVPFRNEGRYSNSKDSQYQITVFEKGYTTPAWMKNGIMYQIFPDRFSKSTAYDVTKNKEKRALIGLNREFKLRDDWGGIPEYKPNENGEILNNDFFGGNLKGVMEKLTYLESLGVTIIYFNPIFEAFSTHRYDTGDYLNVDPILGTNEDFILLCKSAKEKGIKIILDGVFNHTGSDSVYFNKRGRYEELGAYQSKQSKYSKWYSFTDFPEEYEAWWGFKTLPNTCEMEPDFIDFVLTGENSVVKTWLQRGASGFRLDVADELPVEFLNILREAVKSEDPDACIIGEVWEDASNKVAYSRRTEYFRGKQLDSVMNYPLKEAIIKFLLKEISGFDLENTINGLWENYPYEAFYANMNILGTHDTARIFTVLSASNRLFQLSKEEKANLIISEEEADRGRKMLFMATLIQFFMPGVPSVFYGDEIGLHGAEDPFNRGCFDESKTDLKVKEFYYRLFAFRKEIGEIGEFKFSPLTSEKDIYGFSRKGNKKALYIIINRGDLDFQLTNIIHFREGDKIEQIFEIGNDNSISYDEKIFIDEVYSSNFIVNKFTGIVIYIKEGGS